MDKKMIVILNGYPNSGKDSFADEIEKYINAGSPWYAIKISSVERIKEAAYILGWEGVKDEKGREFLAELKNLSIKYFDHPFQYVTKVIKNKDADISLIMVREPEEIQRLVDHYKALDYVVHVLLINGMRDQYFDNIADSTIKDYSEYTGYLYNTGTLEQWQRIARNWITAALKEKEKEEVKKSKFWDKFDTIFGGISKRIK